MAIEVPQNEEISGGGKNGEREGIGSAIRSGGANRGAKSREEENRGAEAFARLDSLPSHDLMIWTNDSDPFLLGTSNLAYLPTAPLLPLFPFRQAQDPVCSSFPLKPAPFYKLCAGLGTTKKSAISLLFDSRSAFSTLPFPFTSNSLVELPSLFSFTIRL